MDTPLAAALPFVAWARIWSPLVPASWRAEAWQALTLPGCFDACESEFTSAFVVGFPAPEVPLLLHATLGRDGASVREDWMRVIGHLGLRRNGRTLPPDHLGVACDVLAAAIQHEEAILIGELRKRYLDPWCAVAAQRLEATAVVGGLPRRFALDLATL
jgi:TorA maturation chaperone TorD